MIFLDTNIFVDVLSNRDVWYEGSVEVINRVITGAEKGCMSVLTIPILWYVFGEKRESIPEIKAIIKNFNIISLTPELIRRSFGSEMRDFEDAIQLYSAIKGNCNFIITRNKKDFSNQKGLGILTPEEFMRRHES